MEYVGTGEHVAVSAASPLGDLAIVQTALTIEKWDEDQTAWTLARWERETGTQVSRDPRYVGNIAIKPEVFRRYGVTPSVWHRDNANAILQAGWVALLGGIAGTSITNKFSATNGRIGVGTSSTAVAWTQTNLQGDTGGSSTTSYYKLVSGAPTISTGSGPATLVFTSTFGTGVANFAWTEFGTDNYTADGVTTTGLGASFIFFNRGVPAGGMGTKVSGQTWTATETISFGYPHALGVVGDVS